MRSTETTLTRQTIEALPNYKQQTAREYSSACPFCGIGEDRFRFWPDDGNFWCRQCDAKGFVGDTLALDKEAYEAWKRKEAKRQRAEQARQQSIIERLNQENNAVRYHHQLTDKAREWWFNKGVNKDSIRRWQLGYTTNCPTCPGDESYTIPVSYQDVLYNIRHRLASPNGHGKYRPEIAGLPAAMFNADVLKDDSGFTPEIVLVEGEIKAMVLEQYGLAAVGLPGANAFKDKWLALFPDTKLVYVALDPGVEEQATRIWQQLGETGIPCRLCRLPVKPDDFIVEYGGTASELYDYLQLGRMWR